MTPVPASLDSVTQQTHTARRAWAAVILLAIVGYFLANRRFLREIVTA